MSLGNHAVQLSSHVEELDMSPANQQRDRRKHELRDPKCHREPWDAVSESRALSCPRQPGQIMKYQKENS